MKKLSIIVPCYNESKSIPFLLDRFADVIGERMIEVVLVDNGSFDETAAVLGALLPRYHFARTTRVEKNQGYGFGILAGLQAATGELLGWTHADLQADPADVVRAYDIITKSADSTKLFVKGARVGRPLFDQFFTMGMSAFETLYLTTPLWDINAQPNIFHRSFFEQWQNPPHDFSLDLYACYMARQCGLKMVRFQVQFGPRSFGVSSWNFGLKARWKMIARTMSYSVGLKANMKQGLRKSN
jgi:glycosyltransferase involved in cell wall biosynthesis